MDQGGEAPTGPSRRTPHHRPERLLIAQDAISLLWRNVPLAVSSGPVRPLRYSTRARRRSPRRPARRSGAGWGSRAESPTSAARGGGRSRGFRPAAVDAPAPPRPGRGGLSKAELSEGRSRTPESDRNDKVSALEGHPTLLSGKPGRRSLPWNAGSGADDRAEAPGPAQGGGKPLPEAATAHRPDPSRPLRMTKGEPFGHPRRGSHTPKRSRTLKRAPNAFFTVGVSFPRRHRSAAFFTTSPCVGYG